MKNYTPSRSSIFLLELILNLLLFTVLVIIGLNFFVKTHKLTNKTNELHRAVTQTNNLASLYEAGDGNLDLIASEYSDSIVSDKKAIVFFDEDFNECDSSSSAYTLTLNKISDSSLSEAQITFTRDEESIYSININSYEQLTPSTKEVPDE